MTSVLDGPTLADPFPSYPGRTEPARVRPLPEPSAPALTAPPPPRPERGVHLPEQHTPDPDYDRLLRTTAEVVLRLALDVVAGRRPLTQLKGQVSPPVLRYLAVAARQPAARERRLRRSPSRPGDTATPERPGSGLRSLHLCRPTDGVAEVTAGWQYQARHRAVAARFELIHRPGRSGEWRCTELRLG